MDDLFVKNMFILLTRDSFRESVFVRDNHKCVSCGLPAKDAHHIMERRLWKDGGYYLENGVSLCSECHLLAESTELSCDRLRQLANINKYPMPEHLYTDQKYDKWGNPILDNGLRLRGELFDDESVQKIIKPVLGLFTNRIKYSRTYHLPWSKGKTKDDRAMTDLSRFANQEVVVTVKMDGENTTVYSDYIHARSIEYHPHPSRSYIKKYCSEFSYNIPEGWRICGENLYAKHSIKYNNLKNYFLVFSIWNEKNVCLGWDETIEYCKLMDLDMVPVLYRGIWNEDIIKGIYKEDFENDPCEGYVVRLAQEFHYKEFRHCVGKFVRENHVQTHGHWTKQKVEPNLLKEEK